MPDPYGYWTEDDEGEQSPTRLTVAQRVVGSIALVVVIVAVLAAGPAGLLVALSSIAVVAVVVLVLRMPGAPARRRRYRPGPSVDNAPFRAYRQVAEQLSWAAVSPRHYDLMTRPLLTELAASRLADRHRVDLWHDPDRARAVVGADVWPWIDPAREVSRDSQPPGVGRETLTRIIERLEHL